MNRRPLKSRSAKWAQATAEALARSPITPNQISMLSMVMAAMAGLGFYLGGQALSNARLPLLLMAALFCQLRLVCNLLDGMVAVEGGKKSPDGPFWNEFPDRISDILILIGLGYGIGEPGLGWAAASMAILTAYVRELGVNAGLSPDFGGPMAKPQRMALLTIAALLSLFAPFWGGKNELLLLALALVTAGAGLTALRRSIRLVQGLNQKPPHGPSNGKS